MSPLGTLLASRQNNRLLTFAFIGEDAPASELVIERLHGTESLSRGFRFEAQLLSEDPAIALAEVLGKPVRVTLAVGDGTSRLFTAYVSSFRRTTSDGGLTVYDAVLVPWTDFLHLRRNSRTFDRQTLREQLQTIFSDHGRLPKWNWRSATPLTPATMCVQFDESDHNYIHARLEHAGFTTYFWHDEEGHTLTVVDDTRLSSPIDGPGAEIRFHPDGGTADDLCSITEFRPRVQVTSTAAAVSGFDFKQAEPRHAGSASYRPQPRGLPELEDHRYEGHYGFKYLAGAEALAKQHLEEISARAEQYEAESTNGHVEAGRWFKLTGAAGVVGAAGVTEVAGVAGVAQDSEFLVLEVEHSAENNYLRSADVQPGYRNRFLCQDRSVPWRPGRGWNSTPARILAPQTAIVVGHEGWGSVYTDEFGRVLVQFHWDRAARRSCWVRVASPAAGAHNGFISVPRVGSEVVIQFLDGNPDHPLVTGCVHNQGYQPLWKLPAQLSLSGLRSRELVGQNGNQAAGRSNHVILDDTANQMQVQVRSDVQASQLSLGAVARIEDHLGRKDLRGQGFELRSDGPGAVRGQGLLASTEPRPNARGHITDMPETVERLVHGQELHQSLFEAAQQAKAQGQGDQDLVASALRTQNAEIQGRTSDPARGRFPEFEAPHLVLASAAGIESTAHGSTHVASNEHTAFSSGGHTSLSVGKSLLASVRQAVKLFAYQAGMKLVSASADIELSALKTSIQLLAKLDITQTAETITLSAAKEVVISGGGSSSRWSAAGITHGTMGVWKEQAASFVMAGPNGSGVPALPAAPSLPKGQLEVLHDYVNAVRTQLRGVRQGGFEAEDGDDATHPGTLDRKGFDRVAPVPLGQAKVRYETDPSDPDERSSYFGLREWLQLLGHASASIAGTRTLASVGSALAAGLDRAAGGANPLGASVARAATSGAALPTLVTHAQQLFERAQALEHRGGQALAGTLVPLAKQLTQKLLPQPAQPPISPPPSAAPRWKLRIGDAEILNDT